MQKTQFVHLHNHTDYSLLDGAIKVKRLIEATHAHKSRAVAITDHGSMFGVIPFYFEAKKRGIIPIIGSEAYIAPGSRFEKKGKQRPYHITLLAENTEGYKNLIKLVSQAYLEGFYYKPRIDMALLEQHGKGLIALSGCLSGEVSVLLASDRIKDAEQSADYYRQIFGRDNFFIEIMDHGLPNEKLVNPKLVRLAAKLKIPLVATNDCHYLNREDDFSHEVLLCIQTGKTINDENRMRLETDQFYLKTPEEMIDLFKDIPEAIKNTVEIAKRCNVELDFDSHHLPVYQTPEGKDEDGYFEEVARAGFEGRMRNLESTGRLQKPREEYQNTLEAEIKIIKSMNFSSYFLIVWDFIKHAKEQGIPVGPGRGSGAGSLVAYAMDITDIDPLRYGLLFERFLNPERVTLPDFDIDFCMKRRSEVIDYVTKKYGRDNVAQIITFGTMAARASIRDVGRALDIPYGEVDRIAKMVPTEADATIDDAVSSVPELQEIMAKDKRIKKLIEIARKLEGMIRHASTHAAGVVISPLPLTEYVPLYRGSKEEITTQYAMNDIETIGMLKMDFLGLRTLTIINDTAEIVRQHAGKQIDIANLPLDDAATFELFSHARTNGIFQFESSGMKDILRKFEPQKFEDLIALNALYRPGPIKSGMIDDFIKRKQNKIKVSYVVASLKEILLETYGVMVYQEQVMQVASKLAGFTMGQADILRRAMGKKKKDVMMGMRDRFIKGALANGIVEKKAARIFELIEKFAGYGFNKSHSTAYALLAYQTAYLKSHYPVHFMAALLTNEKDNTDNIVKYIAEAKDMGIEVLPPDVNKGHVNFTVVEDKIQFGLGAIKNVGESAIHSIVKARDSVGQFISLYHFSENVDLRLANKRVIESLIKSGSFDALGLKRSYLASLIDKAIEYGQKQQKDLESGQESLFGDFLPTPASSTERDDHMEEWSEKEKLRNERETLGFYITGHPLTAYEEDLKALSSVTSLSIPEIEGQTDVSLGGVISKVRGLTTRKGDRMAVIRLEDLSGTVEVVFFPDSFKKYQELLVPDGKIFIKGKVEGGDGARNKVIADEAIDLDRVREKSAKSIKIKVITTGFHTDLLKEIQDLLEDHKGDCPVFFELTIPGVCKVSLKANHFLTVKPSKVLTSALEKHFGEGSVEVII